MVAFTLREATLQDAAGVAHLGATVFSTTFGHSVTPQQLCTFLDESYSIPATERDISNPNKTMVVAVTDSAQVLGFALLTRGSSEPCVEGVEDKIELQRLYVDLDQHGKGVGKRLVNEVEDIARKEGFKNMWLGVWEENTKAESIYAKLGYEVVGTHDFDIGGDIQTDRIMLKKL